MTALGQELRFRVKHGMTKHNLTHHAELDFLSLRHAELDFLTLRHAELDSASQY